jgi:hypothetical protein
MAFRNVFLLVVGVSASVAGSLTPAYAGDEMGAYGAAQGGAVSANPRSNDARLLNPAASGLFERYDLQAAAIVGGRTLGVGMSAVDSRTEPKLALGLGYRFQLSNPPLTDSQLPGWIVEGDTPTNRVRGHDLDLSLAMPLLERKIAFGVGGSFQYVKHERLGAVVDGDVDVGFMARPKEGVAFGLMGRDLLPLKSFDHPARVGAGVWLGSDEIGGFALDASYRVAQGDGSPLDMAAGFERLIGGAAMFGGWHWDGRYEWHAASIGAGWHQEGTWLDLALEVPFAQPFDPRFATFRLGVRLAG